MKNALSEYTVSDAFKQKCFVSVQEQREEMNYITLLHNPTTVRLVLMVIVRPLRERDIAQ